MACSPGSLRTRPVQTTSQSPPADEIFTVVEQPPSFPGGITRLGDYIRQNLRYPEAAKKAQVQGTVYVAFIVTKEGSIKDVNVLKGLGFGTSDEAARLMQSMPRWTPGKQSGKSVNTKYNVAVPFKLSGPN